MAKFATLVFDLSRRLNFFLLLLLLHLFFLLSYAFSHVYRQPISPSSPEEGILSPQHEDFSCTNCLNLIAYGTYGTF
jgi:hypothetical protein